MRSPCSSLRLRQGLQLLLSPKPLGENRGLPCLRGRKQSVVLLSPGWHIANKSSGIRLSVQRLSPAGTGPSLLVRGPSPLVRERSRTGTGLSRVGTGLSPLVRGLSL